MTAIESAIRSILLADEPVHADIDDRIWPGERKQGERRPGVVLSLVTASDPHTLDGSAGYVTGTVQVDVLCPTKKQAKELAGKVYGALDTYCGVVDELNIDWLMVEDQSDIPTLPLEGQATAPTFGVSLDVSFMHKK